MHTFLAEVTNQSVMEKLKSVICHRDISGEHFSFPSFKFSAQTERNVWTVVASCLCCKTRCLCSTVAMINQLLRALQMILFRFCVPENKVEVNCSVLFRSYVFRYIDKLSIRKTQYPSRNEIILIYTGYLYNRALIYYSGIQPHVTCSELDCRFTW